NDNQQRRPFAAHAGNVNQRPEQQQTDQELNRLDRREAKRVSPIEWHVKYEPALQPASERNPRDVSERVGKPILDDAHQRHQQHVSDGGIDASSNDITHELSARRILVHRSTTSLATAAVNAS